MITNEARHSFFIRFHITCALSAGNPHSVCQVINDAPEYQVPVARADSRPVPDLQIQRQTEWGRPDL